MRKDRRRPARILEHVSLAFGIHESDASDLVIFVRVGAEQNQVAVLSEANEMTIDVKE
jgi:hypothetical protein